MDPLSLLARLAASVSAPRRSFTPMDEARSTAT
jgi:hypothetical protein